MEDIKLIATDMDHTLLTESGELPPNLFQKIDELKELGITFVAASGRALFTLQQIFSKAEKKMAFVSDNGAAIDYEGELIYKSLIPPEKYHEMIEFTQKESDGGAVLCALEGAYMLKKYQKHEEFLRKFYARLNFVDSFDGITSEANKFTIFFPEGDSQANAEKIFSPKYGQDYNVTIGDTIWIDIMNKNVNKGTALEVLGKQLGITTSEMMAFGDTYNDVEMLQTVKYSYVMDNATDEMKEYGKYIAPSNDEYGVIQVIDKLIAERK